MLNIIKPPLDKAWMFLFNLTILSQKKFQAKIAFFIFIYVKNLSLFFE